MSDIDSPVTQEYLTRLKVWNEQRDALENAFFYEDISKKTSQELGGYLLVLANARGHADMKATPRFFDDDTKRYQGVIGQLLQVRLNQEMHQRTMRWTIAASCVAVAGLLLGIFNAGGQFNTEHHKPSLQPALEINNMPQSQKGIVPSSQATHPPILNTNATP
jgi:hypothetical protein